MYLSASFATSCCCLEIRAVSDCHLRPGTGTSYPSQTWRAAWQKVLTKAWLAQIKRDIEEHLVPHDSSVTPTNTSHLHWQQPPRQLSSLLPPVTATVGSQRLAFHLLTQCHLSYSPSSQFPSHSILDHPPPTPHGQGFFSTSSRLQHPHPHPDPICLDHTRPPSTQRRHTTALRSLAVVW